MSPSVEKVKYKTQEEQWGNQLIDQLNGGLGGWQCWVQRLSCVGGRDCRTMCRLIIVSFLKERTTTTTTTTTATQHVFAYGFIIISAMTGEIDARL